MDWEIGRLEDLCELITKGTTPTTCGYKFTDSGVRFIKIENIGKNGRISSAGSAFISEETHQALGRSILRKDDILFSIAGALGRSAVVTEDILPANTNQALAIIRLKTENVDQYYLRHFLDSDFIKERIGNIGTQGAQINLSLAQIRDMPILLPPLAEQKMIAEILFAVDEAIEKMNAIIDRTWELKKGLVRKLFAQSKDAHHWKISSVGEYAQINSESLGNKTDPDAKLQYIDISSIERPGVISAVKDVIFKDAPSRARRVVKYGDILVSTVRPYLRAFARVKLEAPNLIASTGFAVLEPQPHFDGEFLYQFILSDQFVNFLEERMTGSNYPAVNPGDVAMCPIPLPPVEEQKAIGSILSAVDRAVSCEEAYRDRLEVEKNSLMQLLLTGKVRT